jgi:hypothetical protein
MKHWQIGIGYALLGVCVAMAVAGFVLGLTSLNKASKASVAAIQKKLDPGAEQAFKDACAGQIQGAAASGVVLVECKLVKPKEVGLKQNPELKGDRATVALSVRDTTKQNYVVIVILDKSTYSTLDQSVVPVAKAPATLP